MTELWVVFLWLSKRKQSPCCTCLENWGMLDLRSILGLPHANMYVWYSCPAVKKRCDREQNHFKMVKKTMGSRMSSLVHQGSLVSGNWILKPLNRGSNLIDLQRYIMFFILDQPEKTLGSVRLRCKFFLFFNLPLVLRGYKSICWQPTSLHSIAGTLNCHETFNAS